MRDKYNLKSQGFTLIELIVSLTLLALLASAAMPLSVLVKKREHESELKQSLITLRNAIDAYKRASDENRIEKSLEASGYPSELRALVDGVTDKKSPNGDKLYFLRKLPHDPMCECEGKAAEDTWETRSYDSTAESFSSGKDVFDLRSTSTKEGINGIPYQDW